MVIPARVHFCYRYSDFKKNMIRRLSAIYSFCIDAVDQLILFCCNRKFTQQKSSGEPDLHIRYQIQDNMQYILDVLNVDEPEIAVNCCN